MKCSTVEKKRVWSVQLDKAGFESQFLCFLFGEGNGIPLQYSCLENPMDGGAWKAAVHGGR